MKSKHLFNQVERNHVKRTMFNLSHEKKFTLEMGSLYPCYMDEVLPGDHFKVRSEVMLRFAPMLAPLMHRVNVYIHYFYVPNRLMWDSWQDFITNQQDINAPMIKPATTTGFLEEGTLSDALGLPIMDDVNIPADYEVSEFPFRAYNMIWNEYYRDQNLQTEISHTNHNLLKRSWEKDYFTSCLPNPQQGGSSQIPIAGSFTPQYLPTSEVMRTSGTVMADGNITSQTGELNNAGGTQTGRIENLADPQLVTGVNVDVNELRLAVRIQEWLERNMRGGQRYVEQLLSRWGVRSSDARLDRPEYLGGGKTNVQVSEVLTTAGSTSGETELPVGHMAGHGLAVGETNQFSKRFEEHGIILGIMSVLPRTGYMQGTHKMWQRKDVFDYAQPEFANLGEQAVKNTELYTGNDHNVNQATFGYQSRYAEYKYKSDIVTGQFRNPANGLMNWHLSRYFTSTPALNSQFIASDPSTRIFAVTEAGQDQLWCQVYNHVTAIRPLPFFGTPTL